MSYYGVAALSLLLLFILKKCNFWVCVLGWRHTNFLSYDKKWRTRTFKVYVQPHSIYIVGTQNTSSVMSFQGRQYRIGHKACMLWWDLDKWVTKQYYTCKWKSLGSSAKVLQLSSPRLNSIFSKFKKRYPEKNQSRWKPIMAIWFFSLFKVSFIVTGLTVWIKLDCKITILLFSS